MSISSLDGASETSNGSDMSSLTNEDVDVFLNHYRMPKVQGSTNNNGTSHGHARTEHKKSHGVQILSLIELSAQKVACHLPFGLVEHFEPPVPEPMQCRIAFWSFPQDEEDVRLYTCLANGCADVFIRAEYLINLNCVCDMLQVGFHLSANVKPIQDSTDDIDCFQVAITFDRRRITSCSCSCSASTFWCQHAVAVCLQRIRKPEEVALRAPVSESLQRLEKNQLQKFAQYLINELPQQILPAAQKLLDELLSGDEAIINKNPAAPDPTAGATVNEQTSWCLDDTHLSADIQKILLKQCTAQPIVCSDIAALHSTGPPAATEYSQLLRPIRGREPEGLWNLISIVGEMMKRHDSNFIILLEIMTAEVLKCEKIVTWWFEAKISLYSGYSSNLPSSKNGSQLSSQYSCSNFCDEIAHLWRLAAMNPSATAIDRKNLHKKFFNWHLEILKLHGGDDSSPRANSKAIKKNILELFPGFKPSMEGCLIDWSDWNEKRNETTETLIEGAEEKTKTSKPNKKKKKKRVRSKQQAPPNEDPIENKENLSVAEDDLIKPSTSKSDSQEVGGGSKENSEMQEQGQCSNEDSPQASRESQALVDESEAPDQAESENDQPLLADEQVERDLQVYFMDKANVNPEVPKKESLEDLIKLNLRKLNDNLETMYAKTEGLYAHGHFRAARKLAFRVANEILNHPNYPSLKQLYTISRRRKKKTITDNHLSIAASDALAKIAFLCNVLIDERDNHHLVFRLALYGIEMKRLPASTKLLEVKLINQKHDLLILLKTITLREKELAILREKAQALRDGVYENCSDASTTLFLGNLVFDALVIRRTCCSKCSAVRKLANPSSAIDSSTSSGQSNSVSNVENDPVNQSPSVSSPGPASSQHRLPDDSQSLTGQSESNNQASALHDQQNVQECSTSITASVPSDNALGFQAALNSLSVKADLLETDYAILCEGIRRQRAELALTLITRYKDEQDKLDLILRHLFDKDIYLVPPPPAPQPASMQVQSQSQTQAQTQPPQQQPQTSETTILSERPSNKKNNLLQETVVSLEASAHFLFEISKSVFEKAGGNSLTTHLFRPQVATQNGHRGLHRRLHMCSLRIALYALGLQNRTSANWQQRTYNGRASFIHEQALEIGLPAIKFLCENWEGHLSPYEAASIADKAGCSSDAETKQVAAEMAKSCLKHANHLDFNAVRRILDQCQEQSVEMIEEACADVEQVAEEDNVCADVLFATARAWYNLISHDSSVNSCYALGNNSILNSLSDQDNGVSDWPVSSRQQQAIHDKRHQYNMAIHSMYWGMSGRINFVPTINSPNNKHKDYQEAAYRLGIKALAVPRPSPHMSNKHNPKKEEDALWLLGLSKSLGRNYLLKFSQSVVENITNPQLLESICIDLIKFLPEGHIDRANILLPLIDKCLVGYIDMVKHISIVQRNLIETIIFSSSVLTYEANSLGARARFGELLNTIEGRRRKLRVQMETKAWDHWLKNLNECTSCNCDGCKTSLDNLNPTKNFDVS